MKNRRHLLRIVEPAPVFENLVRAALSAGHRIGRLDLEAPPEVAKLDEAAATGLLRVAAVGDGRVVSVKTLEGPPVLRDLLRGHFSGCRLVLVQGDIDAPLLRSTEEGWTITLGSQTLPLQTAELVAALEKPHPWSSLQS